MSEVVRTITAERFPSLAWMGAIAVDVQSSKSLDGTPSHCCRHTSRSHACHEVRL
jgi:hypothetical protein